MSRETSRRLGAVGLGMVFLWAAVAKLFDVSDFIDTIGGYGLVWEPLLGLAAWGLIVVELIIAAALLIGRDWAPRMASVLVLVFLVVLGYGIALGLDVECGCFGSEEGSGLSPWQAVGVDCGLLVVCCCLQWPKTDNAKTGEELQS
ncbi:MAG: methylamine utilization protein [Planctomycetaceae bacterium]|nr:methylamine utilization protein [Planctomycetaceae bacterium]